MDQLLLATVLFAPPAAMLLVPRTVRLGMNSWIAASVVLAVLAACMVASWLAVADAYAGLGESEGLGTEGLAYVAGAVWLMGAATSLWMVLRSKTAGSALR